MIAKNVELIKAYAPIIVQLVITIGALVTTILNNGKKTRESIDSLKTDFATANKATNAKVDALSEKLDAHICENEEDNMKQVRTRILRFYDEVCENRAHSENHFEDILDDIDDYEKYVSTHPGFKNNRGEAAMRHIKEVYHVIKETGGFLKHSEGGTY